MTTNVAVHAAGNTGTEEFELHIDGVAVANWTTTHVLDATRQFQTFSYSSPADVSLDRIRIAFVNDGNTVGADRNSCVDGITLNGVKYDTESPGQAVATFSNVSGDAANGVFQTFTYVHPAATAARDVRVAFTNDAFVNGSDRNLRVDATIINGLRYETEAPTVYSTGVWIEGEGVTSGYKRSEWLHTNGFFQYAAGEAAFQAVSLRGVTPNQPQNLPAPLGTTVTIPTALNSYAIGGATYNGGMTTYPSNDPHPTAVTVWGTSVTSLQISNYTITPNTRLRAKMLTAAYDGATNAQIADYVFGWESASSGNHTSNAGVDYYSYARITKSRQSSDLDVDAPLGSSVTGTAGRLVFGLIHKNHFAGTQLPAPANTTNWASFTGIELYEAPFGGASVTGGVLTQTGVVYQSLPVPSYTVTSSSVLELEFKADAIGYLHAVGWDVDDTPWNDGSQPSNTKFRLAGAGVLPNSYQSVAGGAPASDGYVKYVVPIGAALSGSSTATLTRIFFNTSGGASSFRNVVLKDFPPPTRPSTLEVRAAGVTGKEELELVIGGQVAATFSNIGGNAYAGDFQSLFHTFAAPVDIGDVVVRYVNDGNTAGGVDRNVRIDGVGVDGVFHEAEAVDVFSTGTWLEGIGVMPGLWQQEWLHTNGDLQFGSAAAPGVLALGTALASVNESAGTASIPVVRTGGSDGTVALRYTTANAAAIAGSDFAEGSGWVIFGPGDTSKSIIVGITSDKTYEPSETFQVIVEHALGGAAVNAPHAVTVAILDDDEPEGKVAAGDFNGDHRPDGLYFDPPAGTLSVVADLGLGYDQSVWGNLPSAGAAFHWTDFTVGDFHGDGRDDILVRNSVDDTWSLIVGESSVFHVVPVDVAPAWTQRLVGDFDGDGKDEVLGQAGGAWSLLHYDEAGGAFLQTGVVISGFSVGVETFVQDANRDGRDDLITRADSASPWMVSLAGLSGAGATEFQAAADWNRWIEHGYTAAGELDADAAYAKVLEEFSWVYNNVELELYPGLMKGPQATQQTQAGNDWDQAALLERRLQALPFFAIGDVTIVADRVRATIAQLREWLGLKSSVSPANVLTIMQHAFDVNAVALDAAGVPTSVHQNTSTIEFTHAWVRARLPASTAAIDLDPSWKFKDRQAGVPLPSSLGGHTGQLAGLFDEFGYLGLHPTDDRRLPLEFYEDQLMDWLASSSTYQGASLAEVAYDGPIDTRAFHELPAGFGPGMTPSSTPNVQIYESFDAIAVDPVLKNELTHRVRISLKKGATEHWIEDLVVPAVSLDTIHVTFAGSLSNVNNVNSIAAANSSQYFGRLVVNGSIRQAANAASEWFTVGETASIELQHFGPTRLAPTAADRQFLFNQKPGEIISIGLEANQHSPSGIAALQADLLESIAGDTTEAQLIQDIDSLVSYASAKYWYDYNRYNDAIAAITGSIGAQSRVGSGIAKASPVLLQAADSVVIDYLPFAMAPAQFGVDLPNSNFDAFNIASGAFNAEAWQLAGYNASALEHNIVEEVIGAESVSTMKGLQQAYQRTLGLDSSNNGASDDLIRVFESRVSSGTRTVYHVYDVRAGSPDVEAIGAAGAGASVSETAFKGLLASHDGWTNVEDSLWRLLKNLDGQLNGNDKVRVLIPMRRTKVENWRGAVYIADIFGNSGSSMQFAIQADGGTVAHGGFSGDVTTESPIELLPGNFTNAGWVGDPVSPANGNMLRDETDVVYPSLGVPLTFSRHYDSQSKDDFGLGVGWMHTFGDVIYTEPDPVQTSQINRIWLDSTGRRHVFRPDGSGSYMVPATLKGQLAYVSGAAAGGEDFVFRSADGFEYHFQHVALTESGKSVVGRLASVVDRNGDGVQINYVDATSRRIGSVQDVHNANRRLMFGYQAYTAGVYHIAGVTRVAPGTANLTWNYGIDAVATGRRLTKAEAPAVMVAGANYDETSSRPTVHYNYYSTAGHYALGLMQRITEADDSWHEYEYFANGRTFRVTQAKSANDPAVAVQTFNYNLIRRLSEFTDERGNVETYVHQRNGLLTKQLHADRSQMKSTWGAIGSPEEYLMKSATDERGAVENFTYYGSGDSAFKQGQLKQATAKAYPGQAALVTQYDYVQPDAANKPHLVAPGTIVVDPDDVSYIGQKLTTTYQYYASGGALGRLWKTTDPQNNTVHYAYYAASGLLMSVQRPAILSESGTPVSYETVYEYDAAGNVAAMKTRQSDAAAFLAETQFAYDAMGNVVQSIDPTGVITESVYDALGRLRATGYADVAGQVIDPLNAYTTRFKYDAQGRVRESVDPLGRFTRFEYDRQGKIIKQTSADGTEVRHDYDRFGNRIATTDELGRTTRFVYDGRNRLIETIRADGASARVRYDGAGNVVATTDALGAVTTFRRLVRHDNFTASAVATSGAPLMRRTYQYGYAGNNLVQTRQQLVGGALDASGNLVAAQLAAQTKSFYNGFGELERLVDDDAGPPGESPLLDFEPREATFAYFADGALKQTDRYGDYDAALGYRTWTASKYAYDAAGRLTPGSRNSISR